MWRQGFLLAGVATAVEDGANATSGLWDHPCLCLFDVDRTLTGKQGDPGGHCSNRPGLDDNKVYKGTVDSAYGGGHLTLSEAALNLDKTFCKTCHVGVISHGNAGGDAAGVREKLVLYLNRWKAKSMQLDNHWNVPKGMSSASTVTVTSPLAYSVDDDAKHRVAFGIRQWYNNKLAADKAYILDTDTWFFDDKSSNIDQFKNYNYNARQISCKSRDNSGTHTGDIGWCGATHEEIANTHKGNYYCSKGSETVVV